MKFTRREIIRIATATSVLQGWQPLLAQPAELIRKSIPSTGEKNPVIGIGARNYRIGDGWAPGTTKPHHAIDNLGAARGSLPDQPLRERMQQLIVSLPMTL